MKKGWKIFWTVIISLTGAGVVFCIIALCLGVTFSQFEKAYPNGIGIMRKNYVSFDDDWDDDELDDTENVVSEEAFSGVENLKLDIGASEVRIKTGTDDKIHVDDSGMKTENSGNNNENAQQFQFQKCEKRKGNTCDLSSKRLQVRSGGHGIWCSNSRDRWTKCEKP